MVLSTAWHGCLFRKPGDANSFLWHICRADARSFEYFMQVLLLHLKIRRDWDGHTIHGCAPLTLTLMLDLQSDLLRINQNGSHSYMESQHRWHSSMMDRIEDWPWMSLKSLQQFSYGIVLYVLDGKVFCSLQSSEICRISCIKSSYSLCFNAQKVEKEKAAVDLVFFRFVCVCDFHHFSCLLFLHICINVKKLHRVVLVLHVVVVDNLIHLTSRPVVMRHLKLGSTFSENIHCCIYVCMYVLYVCIVCLFHYSQIG